MNTLEISENSRGLIPSVGMAELNATPHEIFRRYRPLVPVLRREDGAYLVLRAADVAALYDETKTRQLETEYIRMRGITSGPIFDVFQNTMLYSNGETHRRRRVPVARTFAFRVVETLRPAVRKVAHSILDNHRGYGEMDFLRDYASIIPASTIASILGLADSDIPRFTSLVYVFSRILSGSWTNEEVPEIEAAAAGLIGYVGEIIARNRSTPEPGFIHDYLAAVDAAGELSEMEALIQLFTLIIGGSDTTRAGIVVQTSLLLQNPSQWQMLVDRPELIPQAVIESLRFEPATASVPRFAMTDIAIDGYVIPRNSIVIMLTISAMRDERIYPNPDIFDIQRQQEKWLPVFGGGTHRCLGEALAKVELEESLRVLVERCPDLRVVGDYPEISGHAGIRRIGNLRVKWGSMQ